MPLPEFKDEEAFEFPDEKEAKKKAAAEDDFSFEVEDDTPAEDRGRKPMAKPPEDPSEDELNSYDEKVQARIKKFTRGYHDERRAKEEALRERQAAEVYAKQILGENKRLQQQLATGSQAYIEQSKFSAGNELTTAKKSYKEAVENGDIDAQADAQAEIARATLKVEKVQDMRPIEVEEKEDFKTTAQSDEPQMSPRTKKWVDANSEWWGVDEEMTMTALGLDKKLAKEYGPTYVGTEEYFQTVDKTMRKRFPEHFGAQSHEDDDTPPQKTSEPADEETPRRATKPATVVAPAARSTPPNRIKLKASEAAIARRLGVPLEQYAKQVALLKRGE
jgi:hypothetical protein